ncbi:MAG: hypothetical protein GY901_02195 [Actinomycetia bacterium]|nr:hypothetical protein [Actinomycetes bacterium]
MAPVEAGDMASEVGSRLYRMATVVVRSLRGVLLVAAVAGIVRCSVLIGTLNTLKDLRGHAGWLILMVAVVAATVAEWQLPSDSAPAVVARRLGFVTDLATAAMVLTLPGYPVQDWGWVAAAALIPLGLLRLGVRGALIGAAGAYMGNVLWSAFYADSMDGAWSQALEFQLIGVAVAGFVVAILLALRNLQQQVVEDEARAGVAGRYALQLSSVAGHDMVGDLSAARMALDVVRRSGSVVDYQLTLLEQADSTLQTVQDRSRTTLKLVAQMVGDVHAAPAAHQIGPALADLGLYPAGETQAWTSLDIDLVVATLRSIMAALGTPEGTQVFIGSAGHQQGQIWRLVLPLPDGYRPSRMLNAVLDLASVTTGGVWKVDVEVSDTGAVIAELPTGIPPPNRSEQVAAEAAADDWEDG